MPGARPGLLPLMLLTRGVASAAVRLRIGHPLPAAAAIGARRTSWHGSAAPRARPPLATATAPTATEGAKAARVRVRQLLRSGDELIGQNIRVSGWVRTVRRQKTFSFIEVNDGTSLRGVQVIANATLDSYGVADALTTGAAVTIDGDVVASPASEQSVELQATNVELVGECPSATYPLQKKRHTLEFLRGIAHLRPRTNTIGAVARVRSTLAHATHSFFRDEGFAYVHTPLITASDCEGAGEMFQVTTLPPNNANASDDFFGRAAYLTVSGQLSAESYACALGDVYTFGPTFRAEPSNTARHLAEFWMIEPEMAFADLAADMDNAEAYVKYVVGYALRECADRLALSVHAHPRPVKNNGRPSMASTPMMGWRAGVPKTLISFQSSMTSSSSTGCRHAAPPPANRHHHRRHRCHRRRRRRRRCGGGRGLCTTAGGSRQAIRARDVHRRGRHAPARDQQGPVEVGIPRR